MALTDKEQELLKIHLRYELDVLDYAFVEAGADPNNGAHSLQRLMGIDCFYMHARNLIEFYHGSLTEEPGRTSAASRFTGSLVTYPSFGNYMGLINDQVAHLNLDRGTNAQETLDGKDLANIKRLLDDCLMLFQRNLTADAKKHWVERIQPNYFIVIESNAAACTAIYETLTTSFDIAKCVQEKFFRYNPEVEDKMLTFREV